MYPLIIYPLASSVPSLRWGVHAKKQRTQLTPGLVPQISRAIRWILPIDTGRAFSVQCTTHSTRTSSSAGERSCCEPWAWFRGFDFPESLSWRVCTGIAHLNAEALICNPFFATSLIAVAISLSSQDLRSFFFRNSEEEGLIIPICLSRQHSELNWGCRVNQGNDRTGVNKLPGDELGSWIRKWESSHQRLGPFGLHDFPVTDDISWIFLFSEFDFTFLTRCVWWLVVALCHDQTGLSSRCHTTKPIEPTCSEIFAGEG